MDATTASAADRLEALAAASSPTPVEQVLAFFDSLPAVEEAELLGAWDGGLVPTGNAGEPLLTKLRWAGKAFRSRNDVDPMVCLDESGERVASDVMGSATIRRVEYRDVVTATMVYDNHPVFDHFRRVSAGVVLGAMDRKGQSAHPLMFFLRRR
jgi:hypothetical protein